VVEAERLQILCQPDDEPVGPRLLAVAGPAGERLELARYLRRVVLCVDDLEPDRRIWFDIRRAPATEPATASRHDLTLYLHPQEILRDRPETDHLLGARPVWQPRPQPPPAPVYGPEDFHRAKAERFLLHQFLFVRDICDGSLVPELVPRDRAEAFQEAWSITVDGRLRRWRMAAASQAERRLTFSRLFSRYGVLLPDHWRIFHALWEREDLDQDRVLELVRRLPGGPR
jgi:hypothetical protein